MSANVRGKGMRTTANMSMGSAKHGASAAGNKIELINDISNALVNLDDTNVVLFNQPGSPIQHTQANGHQVRTQMANPT